MRVSDGNAVLVVAEERGELDRLEGFLRAALGRDAEIREATQIVQAAQRLPNLRPGLVVVDLKAESGPSPLEALRMLWGADAGTRIALVGDYDRRDPAVVEAFSQGAFEYIQRPVSLGKIVRLVMVWDRERR